MALMLLKYFKKSCTSSVIHLSLLLGDSLGATQNPGVELMSFHVCIIISVKSTDGVAEGNGFARELAKGFLARDLDKQLSLKLHWGDAEWQINVLCKLGFLDCVPFCYWYLMKHGHPWWMMTLCVSFFQCISILGLNLGLTLPAQCSSKYKLKDCTSEVIYKNLCCFGNTHFSPHTTHAC